MIQQTHLTAWQSCAPWPKRSQIEQDLRLSRGVAAIFADTVLGEHLAMRGGTVLHKAHLAPAARYSEDIDLVLVKAMNIYTLDQHLRRVLTPVLSRLEACPLARNRSKFVSKWLRGRKQNSDTSIAWTGACPSAPTSLTH
jgi:hypothetical protein